MSFWDLFKKKRKDPFQSQLEQSLPTSSTQQRSPWMTYRQPTQPSNPYTPSPSSTTYQSPYQSPTPSANNYQYQTPAYSSTGQSNFKMPEAPKQPDRKVYQAPQEQTQQEQPQNPSQQYLQYMNEKGIPTTKDRHQKQFGRTKQSGQEGLSAGSNVFFEQQNKMMGQIPFLQEQSKAFGEKARGNIDLARGSTDVAVGSLERRAATDERALAKAEQSKQQQLRNRFAALGTLESGGSMGYTGRSQQVSDDLLTAKANRKADLGDQVYMLEAEQQQYEQDVLYQVQEEMAKFEQTIKDILADVRISEAERVQWATSELSNIENRLFNMQLNYDKDMDTFEQRKYEIASSLGEGTGDPLSQSSIADIGDTDDGIRVLDSLITRLEVDDGDSRYMGPMRGSWFDSAIGSKWGKAEGLELKAEIDKVRQIVGKALEDGVLRKEDEAKYKLIIATMATKPSVALANLKSLKRDLEVGKQNLLSSYSASGYTVPESYYSNTQQEQSGTAFQVGNYIVEEL